MSFIALSWWEALLLAFAIAVFVTWYYIPRIIMVASKRHLTDSPGTRKVHLSEIPTLGGIGIFGGFTCGFLLSVSGFMDGVSYFVAALIMIFFIGLKDDLITIKPYKKLVVQVFAALIVAFFVNLRITNLHGFLGISEIPTVVSFMLTIFLFIVIINALNLIDGIDGLATTIGIISSALFGVWSCLSGDYGYAIMSAAFVGTLGVFLFFNLSKGKYKIFMGDTGSMVIGFIVTVMAIRFNEINAAGTSFYPLHSSPAVSIAILIVPLFDTLRVMIIRIARRQSPFMADKRHIHHMLLRAGCTHKRSTLCIGFANIVIAGTGFMLDKIGILWLTLLLFVMCLAIMVPVYIAVARREGWNWHEKKWWEILLNLKDPDQKEISIVKKGLPVTVVPHRVEKNRVPENIEIMSDQYLQ